MKLSTLSFLIALSMVTSASPQDDSGNEAAAVLSDGGGNQSSSFGASEQTAAVGSGTVAVSLDMSAGATPPPDAGLGGAPGPSGDNPVMPEATPFPKAEEISPEIKDCVNKILAGYGINHKNGTNLGHSRHRIEIVVNEVHGVEHIAIEVLQPIRKHHGKSAAGDLGMGSFETGGPGGTSGGMPLDANATGLDPGLDMPSGTGDMAVAATASAGGNNNLERSPSLPIGFTGPKVRAKLRRMNARGAQP